VIDSWINPNFELNSIKDYLWRNDLKSTYPVYFSSIKLNKLGKTPFIWGLSAKAWKKSFSNKETFSLYFGLIIRKFVEIVF